MCSSIGLHSRIDLPLPLSMHPLTQFRNQSQTVSALAASHPTYVMPYRNPPKSHPGIYNKAEGLWMKLCVTPRNDATLPTKGKSLDHIIEMNRPLYTSCGMHSISNGSQLRLPSHRCLTQPPRPKPLPRPFCAFPLYAEGPRPTPPWRLPLP